MTKKQVELIDKEITGIRILNLKNISRDEVDLKLYELQILIFKQLG